jgi:hypothetical protein
MMKLKIVILSALFAAGVGASLALASDGNRKDHGDRSDCREVNISGTVAPMTLAVKVDRASSASGIAAGSTFNLAVGATGQTVRIKAEACATGTTGAVTLALKKVSLRPQQAAVAGTTTGATTTGATTTGATTTRKHDDDDDHKRTTTTVGTTTVAGVVTVVTTTNRKKDDDHHRSTTTVGTTTTH